MKNKVKIIEKKRENIRDLIIKLLIFFFFFCMGGGGPNEHYGTHEKLSWGCKVGEISSRGITLYLLVKQQQFSEPDIYSFGVDPDMPSQYTLVLVVP